MKRPVFTTTFWRGSAGGGLCREVNFHSGEGRLFKDNCPARKVVTEEVCVYVLWIMSTYYFDGYFCCISIERQVGMGLVKLTVAALVTVVQALLYDSEVGVWAQCVCPCGGAVVPEPPCVYLCLALLGSVLGFAPNSRPL